MSEKIVSQLDAAGYFVNATVADESPLEPGALILPAGAVDFPPPSIPAGKRAKFNGTRFVLESIPETTASTPEEIAALVALRRAAAYASESDPLFFKFQRGESTKEEWLSKVSEIKARFPDGSLLS